MPSAFYPKNTITKPSRATHFTFKLQSSVLSSFSCLKASEFSASTSNYCWVSLQLWYPWWVVCHQRQQPSFILRLPGHGSHRHPFCLKIAFRLPFAPLSLWFLKAKHPQPLWNTPKSCDLLHIFTSARADLNLYLKLSFCSFMSTKFLHLCKVLLSLLTVLWAFFVCFPPCTHQRESVIMPVLHNESILSYFGTFISSNMCAWWSVVHDLKSLGAGVARDMKHTLELQIQHRFLEPHSQGSAAAYVFLTEGNWMSCQGSVTFGFFIYKMILVKEYQY